MRGSTLVLGIGNPLRGDDGVGLAVLEQLKSCYLPADVSLVDAGTAGLEVTLEFEGRSRAIVVDAACFGGVAGEVRRFDLRQSRLSKVNWEALHAQGLGAAIELAAALGTLPAEVVLYGIEPEELVVPFRLSGAVQSSVPITARLICDELFSMALPFAGHVQRSLVVAS